MTIESNNCCLRHEGLSTIPFIPRMLTMRALHEIHNPYIHGTVNRQIKDEKNSSFCTLYIDKSFNEGMYRAIRAKSNRLFLSFSVHILILSLKITVGTGSGCTLVKSS